MTDNHTPKGNTMHQLDRIEAMLTELTQNQAPAPPPKYLISADYVGRSVIGLFGALIDDRPLDAIKIYRQLTGWGLKESKDAVEKLRDHLRRRAA